MLISVCMVAYNEEKTVHEILADITAQTHPHSSTELIFVDNNSKDATLALLEQFRAEHISEYHDIIVLHNDTSVLSSGLNAGIRAFTGEAFVRIDAHASIAPDFLEETVACLEGTHGDTPEYACGGSRPTYAVDNTARARMLLSAEQSRFGASVAGYRNERGRGYVDSIFHAAYKREVIEKVGFFNEELWRTEDNEYNRRVQEAGYRICYEPRIRSRQQIRPTLGKMLKQKNANGYWVGYTLGCCPSCISLFHLVPMCFLLASIACIALSFLGLGIVGAVMWGLYGLCDIAFTVKAIIDSEKPGAYHLLLPLIFPLMHIVYGAGTIGGIFKVLFCRKKKEA